MKNQMFAFLSFFMCAFSPVQQLSAQSPYSYYLDNTCVWYEGWWESSFESEFNTFYINGDTVVNGTAYFKRYQNSILHEYSPGVGTTSYVTTNALYDLVREDSLKRFYKYYINLNWEQFLNDFSHGLNDAFQNANCTINYIDTIFFNNDTLKHFLADSTYVGEPTGVIEGIGTINNPCGMYNLQTT